MIVASQQQRLKALIGDSDVRQVLNDKQYVFLERVGRSVYKSVVLCVQNRMYTFLLSSYF